MEISKHDKHKISESSIEELNLQKEKLIKKYKGLLLNLKETEKRIEEINLKLEFPTIIPFQKSNKPANL